MSHPATFHFNFTSVRLREAENAFSKLGPSRSDQSRDSENLASTQFEINSLKFFWRERSRTFRTTSVPLELVEICVALRAATLAQPCDERSRLCWFVSDLVR